MKSESMWKLHRAMTLSLASKMKASTAAKNKPLGFKWTNFVASLFDKYYEGDASVIMGEINRQMLINHVGSIFSYYSFDKESVSKERVRIGQRIRELREAKGMDAKHLAFYADIDAANLCRIESGKYSVGLDILTKIGYALGMEIDFVEPKHQ